MKVIAINGSPRKVGNTAQLLRSALEGAASQGAETELIHLYDLNFKGCISCFSCKKAGAENHGHCAVQDGLTPVLKAIEGCGGLLLGSPVYLGDVTGAMRCLMERLVFPYISYGKGRPRLFKGQFKTGFLYTMNIDEEQLGRAGYRERFSTAENTFRRIFGPAEALYVTDTLQFDDYSRYTADMFDVKAKLKRRRDVFPEDLKKAQKIGAWLVEK